MPTKDYTIDAAGKSLGRVATAAAKALMGKTSASYTPNIPAGFKVIVANAGKLHITEKKRLTKIYMNYSGHPGGLRKEMLASLSSRKGNGAALKRAIERMLPRNNLRPGRLKRLSITE